MSSNHPYRLLLIEPSPTVAAPIRALLEQNRFAVDHMATTAEARTRDLSVYAALIVDVKPDDLLFVQWLHRVHSHLTGRVIAIAADDGDGLQKQLTDLGVCDLVPKPVNAQEILRAVFDCLEESPEWAVQ
ncbi:MAG TPA: hypothetical protein VHL59_20130 [Thermoanaerobaculia bacterium]|nr:hypothetical protein [Thermoanaerobaculia bacterium]